MIYIHLQELALPSGWETQATAAKAEVSSCEPSSRNDLIRNKDHIWKSLRQPLETLSCRKCWYCESMEIRSDCPVDHFRPKNSVAECPGHPGYWWCAFEWRNYRYSCTYCNSRRKDVANQTQGGKQDHFPLLNEANRAYQPEHDLGSEQPTLLDPTDPVDPGLLWFNEDGQAVPRHDGISSGTQMLRAKASIDLYHLNHVAIVEKRASISRKVKRGVQECDALLQKAAAGDHSALGHAKAMMKQLLELIRRSVEYSAAARATLRGYRDREWVDNLLQNA